MRKLLVIALLVNAGLLTVITFQEFSGVEAGGERVATENGDTNGDGGRDISDATYLLRWLFQGGPEPVAFADLELEAQLEASQADLAVCQGQLAASQDELAALEGQLAASQKELAACLQEPVGPADIPGFTALRTNEQGLPEYTHAETGIVFVRLPGSEELEPFLIAKHEVTQGEYEAVMGSNPSRFTGDDNRPVDSVSWNDLRARDGFLERTALSLPSEAQWEYAARGGTTTEFSSGDECNVVGCDDPCTPAVDHMWYCANAEGTSHPVGRKLPNPFGLHDVHGNVWEWCEDEFSPFRVVRGGSWVNIARLCRSAFRTGHPPGLRNRDVGFRPARSIAVIAGCTRPEATNYNPEATIDDGSCEFVPTVPGFTALRTNEQGLPEYTHDETGIVFVRLPGNEKLEPFFIAKHEVTQGEYEAVMGSNPSRFRGDDSRPVEQVSWNDLRARGGFLERTGLSLPSEAQWEYASRGGTTTEFSSGDECNVGGCAPCIPAVNHMWYCANAGGTTHPVGRKLPNPFGLHDVHGNVYEWCEDEFSPGSVYRVFRGGFFNSYAQNCRSASRNSNPPSSRSFNLGFRPAAPLR